MRERKGGREGETSSKDWRVKGEIYLKMEGVSAIEYYRRSGEKVFHPTNPTEITAQRLKGAGGRGRGGGGGGVWEGKGLDRQ